MCAHHGESQAAVELHVDGVHHAEQRDGVVHLVQLGMPRGIDRDHHDSPGDEGGAEVQLEGTLRDTKSAS